MNILEALVIKALGAFRELETLVTTPQPVSYMQILRLTVSLFCMMYPLTVSATDGIGPCVVLPYLISSVIVGLLSVASDLESPIGNDPTDLNILAMCHALEVE